YRDRSMPVTEPDVSNAEHDYRLYRNSKVFARAHWRCAPFPSRYQPGASPSRLLAQSQLQRRSGTHSGMVSQQDACFHDPINGTRDLCSIVETILVMRRFIQEVFKKFLQRRTKEVGLILSKGCSDVWR